MPSNLSDIRRVESAHRQFTKRLPGLHNAIYDIKRRTLGLNSKHSRVKTSSFRINYVCFNLIQVQFNDFFSFAPVTKTRGHPYRLFVNLARNNTGNIFCTSYFK